MLQAAWIELGSSLQGYEYSVGFGLITEAHSWRSFIMPHACTTVCGETTIARQSRRYTRMSVK